MNGPLTAMTSAIFAAVLATSSASADTLLVPDEYLTIQAAIIAAVDGDEIVLADMTFMGAGNKNLIFLSKTLTVRSASGNREACVIDCEDAGRFATIVSGDTIVVQSITVQNGNAVAAFGGAVLVVPGGNGSLNDCAFQDCTAETGGAVYADGAELTIDRCSFAGNSSSAGAGGGVRVVLGTLLTCTESSFEDNVSAGGGGGLFSNTADPASQISGCRFTNNVAGGRGGGLAMHSFNNYLVANCVFEGNTAGATAGGMSCENSPATSRVQDCIFRSNTAPRGAGANIRISSSPTFVNCLFVQNMATFGGALLIAGVGSTPTIINCTLADNHSEDSGGGIFVRAGAEPELVNSVLWGNEAPFGAEIQLGDADVPGGFLAVSYSDVAGGEAGVSVCCDSFLNWGAGNITGDPLFVDIDGPDDIPGNEDDDLHLSSGSPCIDAADNTAVPAGVTTDLDGNPRFADDLATTDTGNGECPIVDMGAYEFPASCPSDVDCDGNVGITDFLALLAAWGTNPGGSPDIDGDGNVGINDFLTLLANWGACP